MRLLSLPGFDLQAHCSGALFLPADKTLLIADLHLGYSWAQRRRGELGPLVDEQTKQKLLSVCEELQPNRVVFAGDLVHAPKPCAPERAWIEDLLLQVSQRAELIAVRGNHDRAFPSEFAHLPLQAVPAWEDATLHVMHGDVLPSVVPLGKTLVLGHLHPSLCVRDAAGAGQRLPVFLSGQRCILLPAFSPFARGYDLLCGLPAEWVQLLGSGDVQTFIASSSRVLRAGSLQAITAKMLSLDSSAPGTFQRIGRRRRRKQAASI